MKKSYFIGLLLSLGMMAVAVLSAGADFGAFISLPAFIVVIFTPALLIISMFGLSVFGRSFSVAFHGVAATQKELETGIRLFRAFQNCLMLIGFITSLIGLISILAMLMDATQIGPNLALALITLLYSMILIFGVTVPFRSALENRINGMGESESS
ncbi:MAG: hypothetical protein HN368_08205 [Spirochaetales bacterium]|jgi:flagellar motor component MotA|nr:hypothetical protein [Spirochaetales bacterium]